MLQLAESIFSRDVVFDENIFPFAELHPNAGRRLREEILLLPSDTSETHDGGVHSNDQYLQIVHVIPPLQFPSAEESRSSQSFVQSSAENGENCTSNHATGEATATGADWLILRLILGKNLP
jgi:hypothetical protein